jgi:hypothetical protein
LLYTKNKKRYKRFDFTFQVSPNFVSDFDWNKIDKSKFNDLAAHAEYLTQM